MSAMGAQGELGAPPPVQAGGFEGEMIERAIKMNLVNFANLLRCKIAAEQSMYATILGAAGRLVSCYECMFERTRRATLNSVLALFFLHAGSLGGVGVQLAVAESGSALSFTKTGRD